MASDSQYRPIEYTYDSRGLNARDTLDQQPPYYYIKLMNNLERAEKSMSSRYGYQIINRSAVGSGTSNFYFTAPVTSLAKMYFQGNPQRYAGLADGTLWQLN